MINNQEDNMSYFYIMSTDPANHRTYYWGGPDNQEWYPSIQWQGSKEEAEQELARILPYNTHMSWFKIQQGE